jgi:preprotein translocase subunit SecY
VPIQYTRRVVGNKMFAGQGSYIPFKINSAGVMPVIFASTILRFPLMVASMLATRFPMVQEVVNAFYSGPLYTVTEFILVIIFSFVYTALAVNPEELSEHIRKGGGFIPGLRPGKNTANYFNYILTRVGLVGAIYLASLAILPTVLQKVFHIPFEQSGTSMLIVVGVALELANQIESYLIEHKYEGFLSSGRVKSRGAAS